MSRRRGTPPGFWAIWTAVAVDLLGFGIIIPLLPLYADSFGATPATVGLLVASYSLAQFAFAPFWGRVSDRLGRRPILLITIAGSAVGSLILGLAGSITVLFVGRIIDGISGASVSVARAAVADAAAPGERARLMGLLGAAFGVGFVVGPAIGGIAALGGASLPFFVAAAISVVNLAWAALRLPETRPRLVPPTGERAPIGHPGSLRRLIALAFVAVVAFSAFEATFALLGDRRFGMTPTTVALVFAGVGLVLVGTQGALAGPLSRRFGEGGSIRLALGSNLVGFLLIAEAGSPALLFPGLAALAFGQGLLTPMIASAIAGLAPPAASGAALGAHMSASGLARAVGPVVGGILFGVGVALPYRAAAALAVLSLALVPTRLPHAKEEVIVPAP